MKKKKGENMKSKLILIGIAVAAVIAIFYLVLFITR